MVVNGIFEIVEGCLLSVRYEGHEKDEFERIFDLWKEDVEFLEKFFENHKNDLQSGHFGIVSVENAVSKTLEEAAEFESHIFKVAEKGVNNLDETLDVRIFSPLHKNETSTKLIESKAYGRAERSWLRLYAIRIGNHKYLVTGGAIKLTRTMQDRLHTREELEKLKTVSKYLKEQDIMDDDDFYFIDITTK